MAEETPPVTPADEQDIAPDTHAVKPDAPEPSDAPEPKEEAPDEEVIIVNRLSQDLSASVEHGNGPETVVIPPHGSSAPVKRSAITAYTHRLVSKGHARLRNKQ